MPLEEDDSCAMVKGMAHSGSPSLHAILEESPSEGQSSGSPLLRACNAVISTIPITITPLLEEPPVPQTMSTRPQQAAAPTPLPKQLMAHQEERRRILQDGAK
jgi:hypothetical protein